MECRGCKAKLERIRLEGDAGVIVFHCNRCLTTHSEKKVVNDMRKNFTKLYEMYPNLYKKTPSFDVGIGWFEVIDRLSRNLEAQIVKYSAEKPDREMPYCDCVKEKFGGLRFGLTGNGTEGMYQAIEVAELESISTCERCGEHGHMTGTGWMRCLCDECEKSAELLAEKTMERMKKRQEKLASGVS